LAGFFGKKTRNICKKIKKILDIAVDRGSQPTGFAIELRHGDSGVANQVRIVRVTAVSTNHKAEITNFHLICRVIVPKTAANSTLFFGFPAPVPVVNIITFEFLSCYGGDNFDIAPCIINLLA